MTTTELIEDDLSEADKRSAEPSEDKQSNVTRLARKRKKQKMNRSQFTYSDALKDTLEEIEADTGKGSISEVIRHALQFYIVAYEEHKKGSKILIENSKGERERLLVFM